jgi:hypothetical protein
VYEPKRDKQVIYVISVKSILGKLPVVIGDTGTIMDASQCGNDRTRFGLPSITPETAD